jgi:hypothetical protein
MRFKASIAKVVAECVYEDSSASLYFVLFDVAIYVFITVVLTLTVI